MHTIVGSHETHTYREHEWCMHHLGSGDIAVKIEDEDVGLGLRTVADGLRCRPKERACGSVSVVSTHVYWDSCLESQACAR